MDSEIKNPDEYGYTNEAIIPLTAREYWNLKEMVDRMLPEETKFTFPEKYMYINVNTNERIKTVTDKNRSVAKKIVDAEATLNSPPQIHRTAMGMDLLKASLALKSIHKRMIETGVAVHIPTMQAEEQAKKAQEGIPSVDEQATASVDERALEEPKSQMSVVRDNDTQEDSGDQQQ